MENHYQNDQMDPPDPDPHDNDQNRPPDPQVPAMCPICHNEPVNAIQIDCKHIFCYLCIKSVAETSNGLCPLCRAEIRPQFNYDEHHPLGPVRVPTSSNGYYWFYEGYRGWWLYDAETNRDIERAFSTGETSIRKFLAGRYYTIDIANGTQTQTDGGGRVRSVKRERLRSLNILGLAGLKGPEFDGILDMMKEVDDGQMMPDD